MHARMREIYSVLCRTHAREKRSSIQRSRPTPISPGGCRGMQKLKGKKLFFSFKKIKKKKKKLPLTPAVN